LRGETTSLLTSTLVIPPATIASASDTCNTTAPSECLPATYVHDCLVLLARQATVWRTKCRTCVSVGVAEQCLIDSPPWIAHLLTAHADCRWPQKLQLHLRQLWTLVRLSNDSCSSSSGRTMQGQSVSQAHMMPSWMPSLCSSNHTSLQASSCILLCGPLLL
jgi:hypothetical protein